MAPRNVLLYTAIHGLAHLLLGISLSQKYTSFNDLMLISGVGVTKGSFYITSSNFGYLVGTLLAGGIYGRVTLKAMVIILALSCSGGLTALAPWCSIFATMLCVQFAVSVFNGICETFVNTEEIQAWEGNSDSAMQFLSFSYSLGSIFGPLITEPFLAPKKMANINGTTNNTSHNDIQLPPFLPSPLNASLTTAPCHEGELSCADYGRHYYSTNLSLNTSIGSEGGASASGPLESRLHYAFAITALLSLLTAVPFFVLCVKFRQEKKTIKKKLSDCKATRRLPKKVYLSVMALSCTFYYFNAMAEDSFGQYLFFFVTTALDWSKTHGAWINSLYWAVSTASKLVLVLILKKVDTGILLFSCTLGMVFSCLFLKIAVVFTINSLIWISVSGFSLSQAAVYAGEFSWVDANLIRLRGKEASALMIVSGIGGMTGPLFLSIVMKTWSLLALPYIFLVECVIAACLFSIKLFIVKPLTIRKYGPPRRVSSDNVDGKFDTSNQLLQSVSVREPDNDTDNTLTV